MAFILWLVSLPLRLLGSLAVLAACAAGLRDLWLSIAADRMILTPLGELWFSLSAGTLNLLQAGIQRGLHPALWDPVMVVFLRLPAIVGLLILAALLLLLAQLIYRPR